MDAKALPLLLIRLRGGMAERLKAHAWKACVRESVPWVRIPLPPPPQNRTTNADRSRLCGRHFDVLGARAEVVTVIAAVIAHDPLARRPGKPLDCLRRDCLLARRLQHHCSKRGAGLRLVANRLGACNELLQRRLVTIGDADLDGVIVPFHAQVGLGGALVQFGEVLAMALGVPAGARGRTPAWSCSGWRRQSATSEGPL